ncbi:MAG: PAS domain S-box protein [Candidatus Hodarchaeota archaeon]
MEDYQHQFIRIKELLRTNPMGMTVSEIASALNLNRNTTAKYLEMMQFAGHLDMKSFGAAKAFYLSRRIPLSTLLNFTSDQIFVLDRNFTIIQVNEPQSGPWGIQKEDLLGKSWDEIISTFNIDKEIKSVIEATFGTTQITKEVKAIINDEEHILRIKIIPSIFENDQQAVTVICEDITTQARAQMALKESVEIFRTLTDSSLIGMCIIQENQVIYVNNALATIIGFSKEEILTWTTNDVLNTIHSDDLSLVNELLRKKQARIKEGIIPRYKFRIVSKESEIKWIDFSSSSLLYEGKPAEFISMVDITQSKQMEETLQKEQYFLEKLLEISRVIIVALNQKGEITLINQIGCQILEYDKEELIGKNWFEISIPSTQRRAIWAVFKQLIDGNIKPVEFTKNLVVTKSGKGRLIAWQNTVLTDINGQIIGTLSKGEDITDRDVENNDQIYINIE